MDLVLVIFLLAVVPDSIKVDCENPKNAIDSVECSNKVLAKTRYDLEQYVKEVKRLLRPTSSADSTLIKYVIAQTWWEKSVKADCEAVYQFHYSGKDRLGNYASCQIDANTQRMQFIWDKFLAGTETSLKKPE